MPDKPNGNKVTIKSSLNNGLCSTLFHKDNSFSFIYESSDLSIEDVGYEGNTIVLYAKGSKRSAVCPYCGGESHHVHSRYTRTINDLSILGKKVVLILESRKFFCKNADCPPKTFAEQPGNEVFRYRRRTRRLELTVIRNGLMMSSRTISKLLSYCGVDLSSSTILRCLHQLCPPDNKEIEQVGVDDWAWRKGVSYGSIVIDLLNKYPVDLLGDREAKSFLEWMEEHPCVNVVSRDRATGYSSAEGLLNWNGGAGTDWQKELYNSAMVSKVSLNVSGGNKTSTYNLSGSYLNQDGIVNTTGYEAWNIRAKNTFSFFNNHLRMGTTLMMKFYKKKYEDVSYTSALTAVPMWNVYGEDGTWGVAPEWTRGDNPVGWTEAYDYQRHGIDILLNGYAEVDLFLKGLKYKFNVGINKYTRRNYAYSSPYYFSSTSQKNEAELSESTDWENDWLIENTINYDNTFGNHTVSALVGYSAQRNNARGFGAGRKGFPEGFSVIDAGSVSSQNTSGSAWANTMISMFGRVMYSYADRYMLSASVRRDGSSKFADGNRWGTFPSVSLGWNVMNEDFFENIKETMNELKIRASYGVLGNLSGIGNYATQSVVYKGMNNMMGTELWEGAITGKEWTSPMNVTWEKTKTLNLGLDFAFLNNKFSVSADYFIQKTEDMLLSMPQSLSFGLSGNPTVNAGTVENKGFEISLNHRNNVGDLYYHVGVNATFIKNELTEVNGSRDEWQGFNPHAKGTITYAKTGHSIGYFNLIKTDGVFQSQQEIDAYVDKNGNKIQPNAQPGDLRFVDYNGDGKIDNNDRQDVGSAFPKVNLGVSLGAEWKGLDLNMFFDGNFGNKIYNAQYYSTVYNESTGNQYAERMNSWTENNHSDIPRCLFGTSDPNGTNWGYTDRWLENGSFLRLKTLELGYTLPKVWVSKAGLQNVRVYTAMENLFTITDYKGYTPDLGMVDADGAGTSGGSGVMTRGCDDGRYPMARTITFGLQVNF